MSWGYFGDDQEAIWQPPARNIRTGHRVSIDPGMEPVGTRHLPLRWKLAEYPMRWLARSMAKAPTMREITGEVKKRGQVAEQGE